MYPQRKFVHLIAQAQCPARTVFQNDHDFDKVVALRGIGRDIETRQPLSAGAAPPVNYTDIWWNPSESGWGMAVTQQASTMFLAWYVYDGSAKPMWYVATCAVSGTSCSGDLLRTTGPAFGATFDASQVHAFTAGTISINFSDPNNAAISYTVNGVSASKTVTRQLF